MNLLRKLKSKWRSNKKKKLQQKSQLSPELRAWGQEILLESLKDKVNPENYDVREGEDGLFYIWENIHNEDEDGATYTEWNKRYSEHFNGEEPGSFKTFDDAIEAIKKHIETAHKQFQEVYDAFINEHGDDEG